MSRRADHTGSKPFQLKNGYWQAAYVDANGERKTVKRKTEALCQQAVEDAARKGRLGELPLDEKLTVEKWLETWLTVHKSKLAARSVHNYRANFAVHINPVIGNRPLNGPDRVTDTDIERILNRMAVAGLSETTRQHVYSILNQAFQRAVDAEPPKMGRNPMRAVKRPGRDTVPIIPWTHEQVADFRAHVEGDRLEAAWNLSLLCGLRQGELVGLRWSDIVWSTETTVGSLTVAGQLDRFTHQYKARKGDGKTVVMDLPADVEALLWARKSAQQREQLKAGPKWTGNPQDLVFTTRHGTPIPHNNMGGSWRNRVARSGLPPLKHHGTRHYTASYQFDLGASIQQVGALLGQADRDVTRSYIHLTAQSTAQAASRANQLPVRPRKVAL